MGKKGNSARRWISNCIVLTVLLSCNGVKHEALQPFPADARMKEVLLTDSLGMVAVAIPRRYDTSFAWIDRSDCKNCGKQKYRFQPKTNRIIEESGMFWHDEHQDSIDRFTISYSQEIYLRDKDTGKNLSLYYNVKEMMEPEMQDLPMKLDTIEKINDRYFAIFAIERSDTIQMRKVMAATTIRGNEVRFYFELVRKQNDSITNDFIKHSIELVRFIRIGKQRQHS